jgi:hypothetical protein
MEGPEGKKKPSSVVGRAGLAAQMFLGISWNSLSREWLVMARAYNSLIWKRC